MRWYSGSGQIQSKGYMGLMFIDESDKRMLIAVFRHSGHRRWFLVDGLDWGSNKLRLIWIHFTCVDNLQTKINEF